LYVQFFLLQQLYSKQFTRLEKEISVAGISKNNKLLYSAFLANAFNRPAISDSLLKKIIADKIAATDDTMQFHLHRLAYDNAVMQNNYGPAYRASKILTDRYAMFLPGTELQGLKDEGLIWGFLLAAPKQKIARTKTSIIPLKKDMAGLWNIPVQEQDSAYQFIFDTGAGISTITDTYAKKLHLDIIKKAVVNVSGGITGITSKARLGIAKLLTIGNTRISNAVFLILPDSALSFAGGAYTINGIIGLPVIKDLEEIIIRKSEMEIPAVADRAVVKHNLTLDMLVPVIYMDYKGEPLPFTFDSGAQQSLFSDNFYNRYKNEWQSIISDSTNIGGAGGSRKLKMIEVPSLIFSADNKPVQFTKAQISLEQLEANKQFYYGNIGQDLISQFTAIKINFATAAVSLIK
jgi:hypothetical protein